jgi:hypothetical protein
MGRTFVFDLNKGTIKRPDTEKETIVDDSGFDIEMRRGGITQQGIMMATKQTTETEHRKKAESRKT